jgi:hypothetical protein
MYGWWMLDDPAGTLAHDSANYWNDGTHIGGPALAAGQVFAARAYDGSNDYTEVPNHADLNVGTGEFTLDAWIRTSAPHGEIVSKEYIDWTANPVHVGYRLYLENGALTLMLTTGPVVFSQEWFTYVGPALHNGRWHHVAATVRRNDPWGVKLYVDGVPQAFATTVSGTLSNASVLRIGSRTGGPYQGPGNFWNGRIDEIELFKRALTPAEIYGLWRAGSNGKCRINFAPCPGDLNCDDLVDFGDINAFVLRLSNPAAYEAQYPDCPAENADINGSGSVGFDDINPFVALLSGGSSSCSP